MFENKTPASIHQSILSTITDGIDKREGSVAHDLSYPAAIEIGNAYIALDTVIELGFAQTTSGEYLDLWAKTFGLERKPAIASEGTVTLSGPSGTTVPSGTRLQTANDVFYVTSAPVTLGASPVTVAAQAEEGGEAGNVAANTVNALAPGDLYGVVNVTSSSAFTEGLDAETDEALRTRLFEVAQKPSTSGNANHYREWAMSVIGVGDAAVYPLHAGAGTVRVVVVDTDKQPPSTNIVTAANTFIQANKPIGATVTVVGATGLAINVTAKVTLKSGYTLQSVQAAFTEALRTYLRSISFSTDIIRYVKVGQVLIGVEGVADYTNLQVNGGTSNVTPTSSQIGVVGTVTLSE